MTTIIDAIQTGQKTNASKEQVVVSSANSELSNGNSFSQVLKDPEILKKFKQSDETSLKSSSKIEIVDSDGLSKEQKIVNLLEKQNLKLDVEPREHHLQGNSENSESVPELTASTLVQFINNTQEKTTIKTVSDLAEGKSAVIIPTEASKGGNILPIVEPKQPIQQLPQIMSNAMNETQKGVVEISNSDLTSQQEVKNTILNPVHTKIVSQNSIEEITVNRAMSETVSNEQGRASIAKSQTTTAPIEMLPNELKTIQTTKVITEKVVGAEQRGFKDVEPVLFTESVAKPIKNIESETAFALNKSISPQLSPSLSNKEVTQAISKDLENFNLSELLSKDLLQKTGVLSERAAIEPMASSRADARTESIPVIATNSTTTNNPSVNQRAETSATSFVMQTAYKAGSAEWSESFTRNIAMMALNNNKTAEIRMDPPDLGSIQVKIHQLANETQIQFQVQHNDTKQAIEASIQRLKESLAEQGFANINVDIQQGEQSQSHAERSSDESNRAASNSFSGVGEEHVEVTLLQSKSNSGIDYFA